MPTGAAGRLSRAAPRALCCPGLRKTVRPPRPLLRPARPCGRVCGLRCVPAGGNGRRRRGRCCAPRLLRPCVCVCGA